MQQEKKYQSEVVVGGIPKALHSKLHKQLINKFGNAAKCEMPDCKHINSKRYEWALRKGHEYSNDPQDYIQLCPSCHRKYDFNEDIRTKLKAKKYGDKHNAAKLKNEQVIEIVGWINNGMSNKDLGELYNVHPTTICDIKRGKRWGYLTGIKYNK